MDASRTLSRLRVPLAVSALLLIAAVLYLPFANARRETAAARAAAESLLATLDADGRVSTAEYGVWKQLAAAPARTRIAAIALAQEAKYAPLQRASADLLARTAVGSDVDGTVSRQLAETLLCAPLEHAPLTANADVPFQLVPWLNASALASSQCADILTERVLAADPGSFTEGANLLGLVLAALPPEAARPYVGRLVAQAAVADAGAVRVLYAALRHIRSTQFPDAIAAALNTLAGRLEAAPTAAAFASLFDAVDSLKYAATPAELAPLLDTAIGQMLARNDSDLTRAMFFTLTDLKVSHPDTGFGRRADYLMRGINVYSDALEIYDYSHVLRLDEQFAGDDARVARELLGALRELDPAGYLSSIVPYCRRFLETSAALEYREFLEGAHLLVEQLRNPAFIFQRPCLLDSGLVARIAPADRGPFAESIITALQLMEPPGAATRMAEAIELLDALQVELGRAQIDRVAAAVTTYLVGETQTAFKVITAAAEAEIAFAPAFYSELFVLTSRLEPVTADGRKIAPPAALIAKLAEDQRALITATALAAMSDTAMEPDARVVQAELLMALKPSLSRSDTERALAALAVAMTDARNLPALAWLARAFNTLKPQTLAVPQPVQAAWMQRVAVASTRAELADLFQAAGLLNTIRDADAAGRSTVRSAIVRFLTQIEAGDPEIGAVRAILQRPQRAAPQRGAQAGAARAAEQPAERGRQRAVTALRRAVSSPQIALEPEDVKALSDVYVQALIDARVTKPVADYSLSLATLASYAPPGELGALLAALRQRLDESTDAATHAILVAAWIRVEHGTNRDLPPAQRVPLYQDVLTLPLTGAESRALLVAEAAAIADQDFAGDPWQLLAWTAAGVTEP